MNISRAKQISRDMCRIVGHALANTLNDNPNELTYDVSLRCSRCKKSIKTKIRYCDLYTQQKSVLNRALERLQMEMNKNE